jgi:N-acetylglutamate synthase-like GNAT family acetyltransferase/ferredoxin
VKGAEVEVSGERTKVEVIVSRGGAEMIDATFRGAVAADSRAMYELSQPFVAGGGVIARDLELFDAGVDDFYVIEIDRQIVACAGVRRFDSLSEIFNVVVDRAWQGFGLGRFMLASMLVVLAEQGFDEAFLFSKTTSDWFARCGFRRVDPRVLPPERLAMVDPERKSVPMMRHTIRAPDGVEALPQLCPVRVRFDRSGVECTWQGTADALLPFAEKNNIEVDSLCWGGVCGTCSTRLTRGTVSYHLEPDVEPADGEVLLCIARPVTDVVLDL